MLPTTMIALLKRRKRLFIALAPIGIALGLYAILVIWAAQATPIAETSDRIDFIAELEAHADSLVPDPDRARENWSHLVEANRLVSTAIDEAIQDGPDESLSWYDAHLTEPESEDDDANEVVTDFGREVIARLANTELDQHLDSLVAEQHALRPVRGYIKIITEEDLHATDRSTLDLSFTQEYSKLIYARQTALLCYARMLDAIHSRNADDVLINLERALAIGRHVYRQPLTIDLLVGMGTRSGALVHHARALESRIYDERSLSIALDILDRNPAPATLDRYLTTVAINLHASMQSFYARNGLLIPRLFADTAERPVRNSGIPKMNPQHSVILKNRRKLGIITRFHSYAAPIAILAPRYDTSIADFNSAMDEVATYINLSAAEATLLWQDNTHPDVSGNYVIAGDSRKWAIHTNWARHHTHYDAVRLLTAIHLHIARHGAPPDTLNELTPDILHQLPRARIYDADGQFSYRVNDDPDRPFDLWLDGPDLVDNDATPSIMGPGGQDPGEDWVFTGPDAW